jgi:hypothetical protein
MDEEYLHHFLHPLRELPTIVSPLDVKLTVHEDHMADECRDAQSILIDSFVIAYQSFPLAGVCTVASFITDITSHGDVSIMKEVYEKWCLRQPHCDMLGETLADPSQLGQPLRPVRLE